MTQSEGNDMALTEKDVQNIHELETFLKTPRSIGDIAKHLGVSPGTAISYLEVFTKNPKRYRIQCTDLAGPEKKWVVE